MLFQQTQTNDIFSNYPNMLELLDLAQLELCVSDVKAFGGWL